MPLYVAKQCKWIWASEESYSRSCAITMDQITDIISFLNLFLAPPGLSREGIAYYSKLKSTNTTLNVSDYPILVTFKDITDPKTITPVLEMQPYEDKSGPASVTKFQISKDNFVELFGEGIVLKSITIEMSDEPVTKKIKLPPYDASTGFDQWFGKLPYKDPRRVGPYDFKKGDLE